MHDQKLVAAGNPFQGIIEGKIPCKKVYENQRVLVFEDIAPKAPIHLLLIPKQSGLLHLQDIKDAQMEILLEIAKVAKKVASDLKLSGYRLVTNVGYNGGQRVPHLHFHLLSGGKEPLGENVI